MVYEQSGMPNSIEKIGVQEFFCTQYRSQIYKYSLYRGKKRLYNTVNLIDMALQ